MNIESLSSTDLIELLFTCAPNPIFIFSDSGILDCNPAAVKILNAPSKSALLEQHPARFSPEWQPDGRTSLEKSIEMDNIARRNGYHQFEWMHKKFDGTEFPVEVTISPVHWGKKEALMILWNDLTETKKEKCVIFKTPNC